MFALWDTQLDEWARLCSMGAFVTSWVDDEITVAIAVFDTPEMADIARKIAYGQLYHVFEIRRFPSET